MMEAATQHGQQEFIDAMATVAEQNWGMNRMAGRIWAILLSSEKPELSAEELMKALGASRGSVSTVTRTLERIGIVQRVSKTGDRRHYYRIPSAAVMMELEMAGLETYRKLMLRGLQAVRGTHSAAEARMQEYHDLMVFLQTEYTALIERWNTSTQKGKQQ